MARVQIDYIQLRRDNPAMLCTKISEESFFIDRQRPASLQAQIREAIVSGILSQRMRSGARLPSTRRLAEHLGVSRITVTNAYQELVSQGYLTTRNRSAYLVTDSPPLLHLKGSPSANSPENVDWNAKLTRSLGGYPRLEKPDNWRDFPYPFIYGQADWSLFDHGAWRDCSRRALGRRDFEDMAGDMALADDPMLVSYICTRSLPRRGIHAEPEEVLVTLGAQNALWLAIALLTHDGFRAACEDPGYPEVTNALRWNGAHISPIMVDEKGLPPDALPLELDAVFVTPSHHAPTAVTMPMSRRQKLLDAANARDFIIVEDDYDFEMSYLAPPSPALKSLDRTGRVIYVGSFSKSLFPGLRLGYLVAPAPFIREARRLRSLILRHPPGHLQRTAAYFLALGYHDQLIRRMWEVFAERREITVRALQREGLEICGAAEFGGTNLWIGGPEGLDSLAFAAALREDGVLIEPGAPFFFSKDQSAIRFFRIAYSSISNTRIDEGIRCIANRLRNGAPTGRADLFPAG